MSDLAVEKHPSEPFQLGEDVRLESAGVIGSDLEFDGELLQLSAFTSGQERRTLGRIARPSRRR